MKNILISLAGMAILIASAALSIETSVINGWILFCAGIIGAGLAAAGIIKGKPRTYKIIG